MLMPVRSSSSSSKTPCECSFLDVPNEASYAMADAQVLAWLRNAGLSRFASRFGAADVSRSAFLDLAPADLDALGVDSPADRKRLADLIGELRKESALPPRKPSPTRAHTIATLRARPGTERVAKVPREDNSNNNNNNKCNGQVQIPTRARVTVCVRKRPLSRKETATGDRDIIAAQDDSALHVYELKEKVDLTKYIETHPFVFDRVFNERSGNAEVYEGTAKPLVDALFQGGRSTCFAYGQTGAGKTFTMAGDGAENPGLYALAVRDVFRRIRSQHHQYGSHADSMNSQSDEEDYYDSDYYHNAGIIGSSESLSRLQVWISFFEIYGTRLHDLLGNRAKLECREDANNEVQIVGLVERLCHTEEDVMISIDEAGAARSTGVTGANDDSSRSHAVFQIELRRTQDQSDMHIDESAVMRESLLRGQSRRGVGTDIEQKRAREVGRLCFIDLAGSERGSDTSNSTRVTRMEGAEINKSLLALKECIRAMGQKKDHTPFRGSKLTQVLKASFVGKNCRTVMIANVSPASSNVEHTLNTLRYSDRVKEIRKDRQMQSVAGSGNSTRNLSSTRSLGGRRATFSSGLGMRPSLGGLPKHEIPFGTTDTSPPDRETTPIFVPDDHAECAVEEEYASTSSLTRRDSDRSRKVADRRRDTRDRQPTSTRGSSLLRPKSGRRTLVRAPERETETATTVPPTLQTSEGSALANLRESRIARRRASQSAALLPGRQSIGGFPATRTALKATATAMRKTSKNVSPESAHSNAASSDSSSGSTSGAAIMSQSARKVESRVFEDNTSQDAPRVEVVSSADETGPKKGGLRRLSAKHRRQLALMDMETSTLGSSGTGSTENGIETARQELKAAESSRRRSTGFGPLMPKSEGTVDYFSGADDGDLFDEDLLFKEDPDSPKGGFAAPRSKARKTGNEKLASSPARRKAEPKSESRQSSPSRGGSSSALRDVIRHHHMQIEELMRLTEADVQLVRAAEAGDIDADVYAMKLELNLTQKLDMIISLKAKLGWLTPAHDAQ